MRRIVVATDDDDLFEDVDAALGADDTQLIQVRVGKDVRKIVAAERTSVVILDLQIGSMGGVATCLDLRNEEGGGRLEQQHILLLLDREADLFLARRSRADGWLVKPLDSLRLRAAVAALEQGELWQEQATAAP
jgi:DNA-binding response OmpR family regulator